MKTSITIEQLKCFIAVSKEMNFRKAAKNLNISQPPVTRHIVNLEYNLKTKLFERNSRSVKLTRDGASFLTHALEIMSRIDEASDMINKNKEQMVGSITLGFVPSMAQEILPSIVSHLKTTLPQIKLNLRENMSFEQVEALNAGTLDIGLTRLPKDLESFDCTRIVSEPYFLAMHKNHEIVKKTNCNIDDLHNIDFIMYDAIIGRYSFELLSSLFINTGVKPNFVQYVSQPPVFLGLIKASVGVALLPESSKLLATDDIIFKDISLPSWVRSDVYLATSKNPKNHLIPEIYNTIFEAVHNKNIVSKLH